MIDEYFFEKITEDDLKKFEESIGYLLPTDYKNFLLKYNGGIPNLMSYRSNHDPEDVNEIVSFFGIDPKSEINYKNPNNYLNNQHNLLYLHSNYQGICGMPDHILYIASSSISSTFISVGKDDYGFIYAGFLEDAIYDSFCEDRAMKYSIVEEMKNMGFPLFVKSFTDLLNGAFEEDEYE